MLEKDRINLYRAIFYIIVVLSIPVVAYKDYQHWLNPLDLKPEQNPKQHDGSQEFNTEQEFKSSITPAPDEDGVTRYLDPWELHHHGKDSEKELEQESDTDYLISPKDQEILDDLSRKDSYPHKIPVDQ